MYIYNVYISICYYITLSSIYIIFWVSNLFEFGCFGCEKAKIKNKKKELENCFFIINRKFENNLGMHIF